MPTSQVLIREAQTRFPEPPDEDLVSAFVERVRRTGQPETFPNITNTRPPKEGDVVALYHPVDIPRGRRPLNDMAPCPICSEGKPKFLDGGTLIWCAERLYVVGPDCSSTLWADGRLNRAVNKLKQTEREKQNLAALAAALTSAPEQVAWIDRHRSSAEQIDRYHGNLARAAPRFRTALSRYAKGAASGAIGGEGFLRGAWRLGGKLEEAAFIWRKLEIEHVRADLQALGETLAPPAVSERLKRADEARRAMAHVHERLAAAHAFLAADNLARLADLGRRAEAPIPFQARIAGAAFTLRSRDEFWTAPVGPPAPEPPP